MKILVLTSIFPQKDDEQNIGVTPVVKYFSEEWVKSGHEVVVIHNSTKYPKLMYLIPNALLKKINSRFGIVLPNSSQSKKINTMINGVSVHRLPMLKIIPKSSFSLAQIKKQSQEIKQILEKTDFQPDIIIGHWESPQIALLSMFKKMFNVKTAIVFHNLVYIKQEKFKNRALEYVNDIDVIGARSLSISTEVKKILNLKTLPFICYSGIPDRYFSNIPNEMNIFDNKTSNSYVFAGRLIRRKNIDVTIKSLNNVYKTEDFNFQIIGDGGERVELINLVDKLKINKKVNFLSHQTRDSILEIMEDTEVFVMISDNETFGLVYIEAMSRGCLVIASNNGGMDGIIINGVNGFLCNQGDEKMLNSILLDIRKLSMAERREISNKAILTAAGFKDSNVSKAYLEKVVSIN